MSKIFSNTEMESMNKVKEGDRSDKTGVFYARAVPKIKELIEVWFPNRKELEKLIEPKKKK